MTHPVVRVAPAARRDLDTQADWFGTEADAETARRFARSVARTFAKLATAPGIGAPIDSDRVGLPGLRKWRVEGFPKLLVLYAPVPGGIRIARVIHAAQDWTAALDMS